MTGQSARRRKTEVIKKKLTFLNRSENDKFQIHEFAYITGILMLNF